VCNGRIRRSDPLPFFCHKIRPPNKTKQNIHEDANPSNRTFQLIFSESRPVTMKGSTQAHSNGSQSSRRIPNVLGAWLFLGIAAVMAAPVAAQVGDTICACSPSALEFTLDFALSCADTNVGGDGVLATDCSVTPSQGGTVSSLVPVVVLSVDILELDQDLQVLNQEASFVDFVDGDTFTYSSFTVNPDLVGPATVPKTLIVSLIGRNAAGQALSMQYLITYTNTCDAYPVLTVGENIGWTRFVSCLLLILGGRLLYYRLVCVPCLT
jgi:hypothetical protein